MASTRVVSVSTVVGNEATKTASENKPTVERAPFTPLDTSLVSSLPCKKKKKKLEEAQQFSSLFQQAPYLSTTG